MNDEEMRYIQDLQNQVDYVSSDNRNMQKQMATTMFSSEYNENLVKWQLDIKEELERIERLLRKQVPKIDKNGNEYFENPKPGDMLFNEKGVQEILNLLHWYLNKNIILSNFSEEQIMLRVYQFSTYLSDFIFINYQQFGLDDKEKIKYYPLVVMNITNTIEASYMRALNGGERESLRTARHVSESSNGMNQMQMPMMNNNAKQFSLFKPTTWI